MLIRENVLNVSRRYTQQQFKVARSLPDHLVSIYHNDFLNSVDVTNDFVLHEHHTSTLANGDDLDGVVELTSHIHDTDDACLHSKYKNWRLQPDKRLSFQSRVRLTKVGGASFGVGLTSVMAGDDLDDDGAGPNDQTYDGALLFVTETGGTMANVWSFLGSNGANKTPTTTLGAYTNNTWDVVGFDYDPYDGANGILTPYAGHDGGPIVYGTACNIAISGLDDNMFLVMMLKNGTPHSEVLGVDYFTIWQER